MKLIVASDEKTSLTDSVIKYLQEKGHKLILLGNLVDEHKKWKWVEIGKEATERITQKEAEQGILFCWSGTGVCMAANRLKCIRAALCWDAEAAKLARKWDNANVLCLSLRFTSKTVAKEILDVWFATEFNEEGLNEAYKLDE